MINPQLKSLIEVNLLFANPQVTDKARKKGKSGKKLTQSILLQYLMSGLIFCVVYGVMMFTVDFSKSIGLFTIYMALFSILGISQAVTTILNIFFESHDLPAYLPLPFKQSTIFLAKISVVVLTVVPFVLPILVLFVLTGIQSHTGIILSIILGLVLFCLFLILLFGLASIIVFGLAKTPLYRKHKKLVTTGLLFVTMIGVVIGVLLLNQNNSTAMADSSRTPIGLFVPWHRLMADFVNLASMGYFLAIIGSILLIILVIRQWILPKFYEQLINISADEGQIKRKIKQHQNIGGLLVSYNVQLLKDPNLLLQVFSSSLLIPIIMLFSFGLNGGINLHELDSHFATLSLVVGVIVSFLVTNPVSIVSLIISLDKENFTYTLATPLDKKYYLKIKFYVGLGVQLLLTTLLSVIVIVLLKTPWLFGLAFLIGSFIGNYIFGSFYFWRDYRLFNSHWTNITQLFSRGSGTFGLILLPFLGIIVGGLLLFGSWFIVTVLPGILGHAIIIGSLLIVLCSVHIYYYQKYWKKQV